MKKSFFIPDTLKKYYKLTGINHNTLLSVNPKINKNSISTYGVHLAPHTISGFNLCPMALNCSKICLHAAGVPYMYDNKLKARINKSLAFNADSNLFLITILINLLKHYKNNNYNFIGLRLNLTSDIQYENFSIDIDSSIKHFIYERFNINIDLGKYDNIFRLILDNGLKIICYDYTKVYRRDNFKYCKKLNYKIAYSYDGYSNKLVRLNCLKAFDNGLNIAACIDYKKSETLPRLFYSHHLNKQFKLIDGDKSDSIFSYDKFSLIGLRFKLPHAFKYSSLDKENFILR